MHTIYYRYENGSYSERTVSGETDTEIVAPPGATEVTEAEYRDGVAALDAARAAENSAMEAADQERARQSYDDLVAAGIPDETARRLSGYQGPADGEGTA
ncbi:MULTISPECIES: hypothetical protein [Streptomyces]|uniref:Uncharacterized protein n=1 Tax=Streptomyces flavovirens TaxID=52258 RepID=A0ABV8NC09_9ACTN|nr:hypothetical protein [Streptomyces sp. MBT51]MBK3592428.1 hypothetical protein [Streptomyces sp. MBT51]